MLILNPDILTVSLWLSHPMFSFHFIRSYVAPLEFILLQLTFLSFAAHLRKPSINMFFSCLFQISRSSHHTLGSCIWLNFTNDRTFLYPGNWKFKFQDVITFLFVQRKKQTNDISFVKCKPP